MGYRKPTKQRNARRRKAASAVGVPSLPKPDIGPVLSFARIAQAVATLQNAVASDPLLTYAPHPGQRAFHSAPHPIRCLVPGNGWGKTSSMCAEASWWLRKSHPYQRIPPMEFGAAGRPVLALWFCQEFRQFEIQGRAILEKYLPADRIWNENKSRFYFPRTGSYLYVASADRDWKFLQGIELDLCCFDEEPPVTLWREMRMRRRGQRKTRYVFAATATSGESWMEAEFYKPWLAHHAAAGLDEGQAMAAQTHPDVFMWPRGGIHDNPGADEGDRAWYQASTWSSEAEKRVRLSGGFARFAGTAVFDAGAIEAMRGGLAAGEDGWFDFGTQTPA